jgi:oligosaccharyl transferase (archaeosortase A-associated)
VSERPRAGSLLVACLAAAAALWIRVRVPFARVFHDGWVNFQGDAWYHVRAIEHLARNFPHRIVADPYAGPGAPYLSIAPLFDYAIATVALVAGLGHPSPALVERIAAFAPALLGAAATLLVYAIGERLFDRRTAALSAALLAIMPGPFLDRTLLGAADHHGAEIVLVLTVIWMVASVCGAAAAGGSAPQRRAAWTAGAGWAAGAALGAYYLTWTSAPLFAFGLALWASLQAIANRATSRSSAYLASLLVRMSGTALVVVFTCQNPGMFRYGLQIASLGGLFALGAFIGAIGHSRTARRTAVAVAVLCGVAAAAALATGAWHLPTALLQDLARFKQGPLGRTVAEMQPLLAPAGAWTLAEPWRVFRSAFYVGVPALAVLAVRSVAVRDGGARLLLVVWGALTLAATLGQVRFGYYLAPILALATGWTCSSCVHWIGGHTRRRWALDLTILIIAGAVFYPSLRLSLAAAGADDGMPNAWKRSLDWMRAETPDPFGDPATYFKRYDRAPMPRPAYTVMNWWDYGYWIVRAGRRVPIANATQSGAVEAARFFTATSEADAVAAMTDLGARYAIVDSDQAFTKGETGGTLRGKFDGAVQWAGRRESEFFETVMTRAPDGRTSSVVLFYPDYYRAMAVRLSRSAADGEAAAETWVVSLAERPPNDTPRHEIVAARRFASYADAETYRAGLGPGEHRLAGLDPERACVPLPALRQLRLAHEESSASGRVRIFAAPAGQPQLTPRPFEGPGGSR